MVVELTEIVVLWTNLRHIKLFYDVYLLSLIAKSTLKITFSGGYTLRTVFFKSLNNDDKKYNKNSTVNVLVV